MQRSIRTYVTITVPVKVEGFYDSHGEFRCESAELQLEQGTDVLSKLSPTDVENIEDEANATYPDYAHEFGREARSLAGSGL